MALKSDGTVVAWGDNSAGQSTIPAGLSNVIAVSAGASHGLALRSDGTIIGWGYNGAGQLAIPRPIEDTVSMAAGEDYAIFAQTDGTVSGWGYGPNAIPTPGLDAVIAAATGDHQSLALRSDGTVVAWGWTNLPPGLTNITAIAVGCYHSMALNRAGIALSSQLRFLSITMRDLNVQLLFQTFSGSQYSVQATSSLNSNNWVELPGSLVIGNGRQALVTDPNGISSGGTFYRLLQSRAP